MNDDVSYILEKLESTADGEQCLISYNQKVNRIKRRNYYPTADGVLIFKAEIVWEDVGFSVGEMKELLLRYSDKIKELYFETIDSTLETVTNIFEVDNIGNDYNLLIIVGDKDKPLKTFHNPENVNWLNPLHNNGFNYYRRKN